MAACLLVLAKKPFFHGFHLNLHKHTSSLLLDLPLNPLKLQVHFVQEEVNELGLIIKVKEVIQCIQQYRMKLDSFYAKLSRQNVASHAVRGNKQVTAQK